MPPKYKLDWYLTVDGDAPVHRWLTEDLSEEACELIGAAMLEILQEEGPKVCGTRFGRQLGDGVFEFRLDGDPQAWIDQARARRGKLPRRNGAKGFDVQFRIFCHAHGDRIILLLGAYDKGHDVSKKRQQQEIAIAKKRLQEWTDRSRHREKGSRSPRHRKKPSS